MRNTAGTFKVGALGVLALLMSAAPSTAASARAHVAGSVGLSDGRTFAHWAHPERRAFVRRRPSHRSGSVARLRYLTEDGYPEVYAILRRFRDRNGRTWFEIGLPLRPNGRTGWVREFALGRLHRVGTRLVVDRVRLRATLYRSGKRIWQSRVGVGKASSPTPAGRFWIREKFRVAKPHGQYGPRAFGTSSYSRLSDWPGGGVVGIHGTDAPALIPGRPSHGCIRVRNQAIKRLYRLMPIGTPMLVR